MSGRISASYSFAPKYARPTLDHLKASSLEDLLDASDIITRHVPLTDQVDAET